MAKPKQNGGDSKVPHKQHNLALSPSLIAQPLLNADFASEDPNEIIDTLSPLPDNITSEESSSRDQILENELADNVSLAAIDSEDSDKDWYAHLNSLSVWASPLYRLCFVLFLLGICITIAQPSMEVIFYRLACQALTKNSNAPPNERTCDPVEEQKIVSTYLMWSSIINLVVSLATCSKASALSDIYGRKPFLTAFVVLLSVNFYMDYFLIAYSTGFPMVGMWIATIIGALSGGPLSLVALFKAFITDITDLARPQERVNSMSYALVAFSAGQIVGPLLSSLVLTHAKGKEGHLPKMPLVSDLDADPANMIPSSELAPLKLLLLVLAIALLYSVFFLPELRSGKLRMKSRSASMVQLRSFAMKTNTVWSKLYHGIITHVSPLRLLIYPSELKTAENSRNFKRTRVTVICLTIIEILLSVVVTLIMLIELQYCIYKYNWESITISNFSMSRSLVNIVAMGVLLPLLYKLVFPRFERFAPKHNSFDAADALVMCIGFSLLTIALAGASVAPTGVEFAAFAFTGAFSAFSGPVAASAPVKFYPTSKVGEYYGAVSLSLGVLNLLTPMVSTALYKSGINQGFPGLPFVFISLLAFISFVCTIVAKWFQRTEIALS